jgi:hypothetical protein
MSDEIPAADKPPAAPQETTCVYVVEAVSAESRTAQVKFINPYYSGNFIVEENVPVEPAPGSSGDGAESTYTTKQVDKDPNPHLIKSVNVPFSDGGPDLDAFADICAQQARGARNRMEATYARNLASVPVPADISGLVGLTNKAPSQAE